VPNLGKFTLFLNKFGTNNYRYEYKWSFVIEFEKCSKH